MIRNLNQVTFQIFGTVPPDRAQDNKGVDTLSNFLLPLSQKEATVYRARSDTRLGCSSGKSVLSGSQNGKIFQRFYVDKIAYIKRGIYFSLSAVMREATVLICAQTKPERTGVQKIDSHRVDHKLHIGGLYTFF